MKTFRLHLVALLLLCFSSWASAAWYLTCPAGTAGGGLCVAADRGWYEVGTYPAANRSYVQFASTYSYLSAAFVGTVANSIQCSGHPVGAYCESPMVQSVTPMTVVSPVSCIPSPRTIDPCPSGYAPSTVLGTGSSALDSYSSAFEKLPIQDMIYASMVAICGLLGVAVGTRLS